jgi:hypothetical protein
MAQQESERQRDLERRRRQESLAREREWERLRERERMQREAEAQREREAVRVRLRYTDIYLFNLILSITQLSTRYYSSTLILTKRRVCALGSKNSKRSARGIWHWRSRRKRERGRGSKRDRDGAILKLGWSARWRSQWASARKFARSCLCYFRW